MTVTTNQVATGVSNPYGYWVTLAQSGIAFVMPSSGSIGNNGALSGLTGFNTTYGYCYCYFPVNAIFTGSVAGWYLTNLTSATAGTIYNNVYLTGTPSIPSTPTPFVSTGPGAYTQTTGSDIPGPNVTVPANSMGPNGCIYYEIVSNNNNNANNKKFNTYFSNQVISGVTETTTTYHGAIGTLKNRGSATSQIAANGSNGDVGSLGGLKYINIDTTLPQVVSHQIQLATATDYAVIESFAFVLRPQ